MRIVGSFPPENTVPSTAGNEPVNLVGRIVAVIIGSIERRCFSEKSGILVCTPNTCGSEGCPFCSSDFVCATKHANAN
ncbi:hypothetical protein VTH06DRAFT_2596 [Thermothelomyces fergusii]